MPAEFGDLLDPAELGEVRAVPCEQCTPTGPTYPDREECSKCLSTGLELEMTRERPGLLLLLAVQRWIYSAEPERVGRHIDELKVDDMVQFALEGLQEHGLG